MKLLLFSDHEEDCELLSKMINAHYPKLEIKLTSDVETAMNLAATDGPFGIFIIDCDLKETDPNALGLNLIEFTGPRPLLLIGNEHRIKERISDDLFNSHEVTQTLSKPLKREGFTMELKECLALGLDWVKKEEFEEAVEEVDPSEFLPMKIRSLYLYDSFPFDLYLAITSKNYIKLISANKPYSHGDLSKYARKNVKNLYIKKDDQIKFLENEAAKCITALNRMVLDDKDIYLIFLRSTTILHQYILALGVNETVTKLTTAITNSIIEHYKLKLSIKPILKNFPHFYPGIASKSILTAFIAEAIAWKLGWESQTTKQKLAVCALLHDITLPEETMSKANSLNSSLIEGHLPQDIEAYKNHPITAAAFAKQFSAYSDIDYIIEMHHELPNRRGFPNRPSTSKLTQICSVFNVAQYIAAEIDGVKITDELLFVTTKHMASSYSGGFFRETMKIAKSIMRLK